MSNVQGLGGALEELRRQPHWVLWRMEERSGKPTKVPYACSGRRAESNNPATWSSHEQAQARWERSKRGGQAYDGIGYVFAGDITGTDLDHCVNPDGSIDPWAQRIITRLDSYAEYSPSGTGVHLFARGSIPKGMRRAVKEEGAHPEAAIEMYSSGRYFTVTGKRLAGVPDLIADRQSVLNDLYTEVASVTKLPQDVTKFPQGVTKWEEAKPALTGQGASFSDEQLLERAMAASNGGKFRDLFYGGAAGYLSSSEADMALCMLLAFWTGRETSRMDRLFRRSALMRDKWDTARSSSTYGAETIARAAARCHVTYNPESPGQRIEQDIAHLLQQIAHQQDRSKKQKPFQIQPREVPNAKVLAWMEMNEYGDALFFSAVLADQVCYDHSAKEWYLWSGQCWKQDATNKVRQLVAGVLGSLYLRVAADLNTSSAEVGLRIQGLAGQGNEKDEGQLAALKEQSKQLSAQMAALHGRARDLRGAKRNANVLAFAQSELGITAEMWDTHPWLLATPTGVVDLHTGRVRDGDPLDYIRTVAPTEWAGLDTPCPRFEQFLQEIFEDKADRDTLIAFLQRLLGYGITGLTTLHIFTMLYGAEGRNGKDTLMGVIKAVLGPLAGAVSKDVLLTASVKAGGAPTPHLCDLQGKRLVWCNETKEGDRLDISQVKDITGGGDISARQLHGHQYSFAPTHKLLLMTNYKPHAEARDKAFWSRVCLIDFGLRFVAKPHASNERLADPALREALQQERSGILAWLVRGCLSWQQSGLEIPASVQLATNKYQEEEDKILQFLQECCVQAPHAHVQASVLFTAYRTWSEGNQFGKGMNGKLFSDEMSKRFQKKISKTGRIYQGVGLLAQEEGQAPLFEEVTPDDEGDASVIGDTTRAQTAPEANGAHLDPPSGDAGDVSYDLFPLNRESSPSIEGIYGKWHHPHHRSPVPVLTQTAPEANGAQVSTTKSGITSASPPLYSQICTTCYEKHLAVPHEARATYYAAGYWWCVRCVPQRTLMEYGQRRGYPQLSVPAKNFMVRAGEATWLTFAQGAGYSQVSAALAALEQQREENDQHA